ncbi:thermosome subunit 1 [Haloplanus rallus]|jgi:chaperonin GroEL (HSP60 family)|uniref:Thermosome subunit 1 n=1 Tax=Haloplanus rallus TaxID=1816183 RepID=A0A6B9FDH0_9EURY|nr:MULTISPECIES: thermosome subunit alpha [Haloplanus]QGX94520.1 thermosome subunit 1 [Haloplanus rallus]
MSGLDRIANVTGEVGERDAAAATVRAGVVLSEMLRTTLGPTGRDKMLVGDGTVVLTNDGASIVDRMEIESPAARIVADVARAQSGEVGDGATSAIVLAGALLDEASSLLDDGFHPTTVVDGYRTAAARAGTVLDDVAWTPDPDDGSTRRNVVATSITGRWDEARTAFLSDLAVRAFDAVRGSSGRRLSNVTIHGVAGGGTTDSELLDGLVVDTDASSTSLSEVAAPVPQRVDDARVAVVDDELTIQSPDAVSRYSFEDVGDLERAQAFETGEYRRYVEALSAHDVDVLFCQKSVDDRLRTMLAREGVLVFERTRQDEVHKLERATGARPVMRLDALDTASVGRADAVERVTLGDGAFVIVRESTSSQVSVLLRGGTDHVVDETERIVVDAVGLLDEFDARPRLVAGGGAVEVALATDVRRYGRRIGDREAVAVEAFADALETIPVSLARNAGLDPIDSLLELRRRHADDETRIGVDGEAGGIADVSDRGVVEPARLKRRVVANATDAAALLLRIDGIIETGPSEDGSGGHDHDHDHDGPHAGGEFETDPHGYPWAIGH